LPSFVGIQIDPTKCGNVISKLHAEQSPLFEHREQLKLYIAPAPGSCDGARTTRDTRKPAAIR
jgi:hypothetical protein